jgi:hypothetical protein
MLVLSSCSTTANPESIEVKPIVLPTPDAAVAALLPKGPHTFTGSMELKTMSSSLKGYVDFDDCTTDASASYTSGDGSNHTVEYRNSGRGEAFSTDGGAWTSTGDPSFDAALTSLVSPVLISSFTIPAAHSIVCSLNLLAQYASLSVDAGDSSAGIDLVLDHDRVRAYNDQARRAFAEEFFSASGATKDEIKKLRSIGSIEDTFVVDVPSASFLERHLVRLTRLDGVVTIQLTAISESGEKFPLTYTFTPTTKRTVEPVQFTTYFDALRDDPDAVKGFREYYDGEVGK